jgi:hypothetical protein
MRFGTHDLRFTIPLAQPRVQKGPRPTETHGKLRKVTVKLCALSGADGGERKSVAAWHEGEVTNTKVIAKVEHKKFKMSIKQHLEHFKSRRPTLRSM